MLSQNEDRTGFVSHYITLTCHVHLHWVFKGKLSIMPPSNGFCVYTVFLFLHICWEVLVFR